VIHADEKLRHKAFEPSLKTNQNSITLVVKLNKIFVAAIIEEFASKKSGKVACRYISEWMGEHSYAVMK